MDLILACFPLIALVIAVLYVEGLDASIRTPSERIIAHSEDDNIRIVQYYQFSFVAPGPCYLLQKRNRFLCWQYWETIKESLWDLPLTGHKAWMEEYHLIHIGDSVR